MADEAPKQISIDWTKLMVFLISTVGTSVYFFGGLSAEVTHIKENQTESRAEIKSEISDLKTHVEHFADTSYRMQSLEEQQKTITAMVKSNQDRVQFLEERISPPQKVYTDKGR